MMTPAHPSFTTVLIAAYWDLQRVLRALWRLALIAGVLFVGLQFASLIVPYLLTPAPVAQVFLRLLISLGATAVLAPFLMAAHRFVLLDEVTHRYAIEPANPRCQLFVGWLVVLALVANIPSVLLAELAPAGPIYYTAASPTLTASAPTMMIIASAMTVVLFLARIMILLPAVATDAPGTTWQNAMRDTRGSSWFIALASIWALISIFLLSTPILLLLRLPVARR